MSLIGEIKAASRQALHESLAADAFYTHNAHTDVPITVRWHNKLARAGALEGGFDVEIIQGIDRLVFNEPELVLKNITLQRGAVVRVPELGDATFRLDVEEERDGPINIYWTVVRES